MTSAAPDRAAAAALLRVGVDAPPAEVQRAFLRAVRLVHPDAMPEADEAARRAGGEAFGRLVAARDALLQPAAPAPPGPSPAVLVRTGRTTRRDLGTPLLVLALLAFLLVGLVGLDESARAPGGPFAPPASAAPRLP